MATRAKLDVDAIGRRALGRREALGLEQEEVASRSGMSRAYISRLENGVVKAPKVTDLGAVAEALEISLDALIYGDAPQSDDEVVRLLGKMPGASIALTNLARGLQWAEDEDREFVVGQLELLAQRFGRSEPTDSSR